MSAEQKQQQWSQFATQVASLRRRGQGGLRSLSERQLGELIDSYQALVADLARARSLGAPPSTVDYLNRLAVAGHTLLYGYSRPRAGVQLGDWSGAFARAVRGAPGAVLTAFLALFVPAILSYLAVQLDSALALSLVPPEFYDFKPTSSEHLHDIPHLTRPLVSSMIISNNLQVTFLAFALGITAGIGTTLVLVHNGVSIGSVAGWMTYQGQGRALWGWILPHGSTELIALCLAGAAGYLLADAILAPGLRSRVAALQQAGAEALKIELGCMVMLVFAGLIEGHVSPSPIPFGARLVVLAASLAGWAAYFSLAGRAQAPPSEADPWWSAG